MKPRGGEVYREHLDVENEKENEIGKMGQVGGIRGGK